ncbi:uncharacterized protein LOC132545204 [Ylistrum balloti]|uniref:uncharacterized protein LOC132545204 n=1 Tax=Ylistrum balloti TaxID=509963 RepID=UPI00290588D2|nr:uncharacterized protein LOC132545204 [Ylistrum balloti]
MSTAVIEIHTPTRHIRNQVLDTVENRVNLKKKLRKDRMSVVVPNVLMCLLGLQTIQEMVLVTNTNNKIIAAVHKQLGDLGKASLKVNSETPAKTLPCRKIPIAIQDDVKRELDSLVTRGVLVSVTEPTPWGSQMAVVHKSHGKLRICIDPQPLNTALTREHFKLPTLDDVLPKLSNTRCFSKLDVKEPYWQVKLDAEIMIRCQLRQ